MPKRISRERWLPITDYEDRYEVSTLGRVRSLPNRSFFTTRIRKASRDKDGYLLIGLYKDQRTRYRFVHKLVLETFVGPCPPGRQARHLDGDNGNAALSNLIYGTPLENAQDKRDHGTIARGSRHGHAKLDEEKVARIKLQFGIMTQTAIAKENKVALTTINAIYRGVRWKHV